MNGDNGRVSQSITPAAEPPAVWRWFRRSLLAETGARYWTINGPTWAAATALRILLATLPTILISLVLVSQILDPGASVASRAQIARAAPSTLRAPILAELTSLRSSGGVGAISLVALLWTGSGLFGCLESFLAAAYGIPGRSLWRQKLLAFAMVAVLAVVAAASLIVSVKSARPIAATGLAATQRAALAATSRPHGTLQAVVAVLIAAALFSLLYHVLPNRRIPLRQTTPGAVFAAAGVAILTLVWPLYVRLADHGTSSSRAVLLLFVAVATYVYVFAEIVVTGGVLNAVIYRRGSGTP